MKEKNKAAEAMSKLAVAKRREKYTPEELREISARGGKKRWEGHTLSETASARSHRKRRAKLKQMAAEVLDVDKPEIEGFCGDVQVYHAMYVKGKRKGETNGER